LTAGLEHYDEFKILTAENGKDALSYLEENRIDLVLTDLKMPVMDGFELLAHLKTHYPNIPVMVMSAYGTPETEETLRTFGTLKLLEKPVDIDDIGNSIMEGLDINVADGSIVGISLANFVQLMEIEEKTSLLEIVTKDNQKGYFYFKRGILYDAIYDQKKGEKAAVEMMQIDNVKIRILKPPRQQITRRIQKNIMALIMESVQRKDASEQSEGDLV